MAENTGRSTVGQPAAPPGPSRKATGMLLPSLGALRSVSSHQKMPSWSPTSEASAGQKHSLCLKHLVWILQEKCPERFHDDRAWVARRAGLVARESPVSGWRALRPNDVTAHKAFKLSACSQVETTHLSRARKVLQALAQPLTASTPPFGLGYPASPSWPQLPPEVLPQGLCTAVSQAEKALPHLPCGQLIPLRPWGLSLNVLYSGGTPHASVCSHTLLCPLKRPQAPPKNWYPSD